MEKQVSSLTEIIVNNRKKMFGKSSEQMKYVDGAAQLTLFNEAEKESDAAAEEPTKETLVAAHKRKAKRTKKELTEDLKHIKEVIKLEEPVCEICGGRGS
ncbi:MAG: transposase [Clostridiales bacterium]|nr:transposase [Clostridiales bacterium]